MNLKDLGSFTIQIVIGQSVSELGLCDLGESINLMPTSFLKKMRLGSPRPTIVVLQMVDRLFARPNRIVEDALAQVGSIIFLVEFIILYFDADPKSYLFWVVPS